MLTYKEYYDVCRKAYSDNTEEIDIFKSVDLKVNYMSLPKNYNTLIEKISKAISHNIDTKSNIKEEDLCIKVNFNKSIPEISYLGNLFAKEIENKIYKSFALVDYVHIYRSINTKSAENSSWLWHTDNSVNEQLKVMIYLTDVNEDCGPFTSFVNKNMKPLKIKTSKISPKEMGIPKFPGSRVPDNFIKDNMKKGYGKYNILGKKGTTILFDQNMIHRATIPKKGNYRDVIIFNFRPFHKNLEDKMKYVKYWTGDDVKRYSTEVD